jgi:N-acetylglucosaminyldiphosphoundecaprenol N-acetyl-beta-D-mannosaminyltransferase
MNKKNVTLLHKAAADTPPRENISHLRNLAHVNVLGISVSAVTREQLTDSLEYALENNYSGWFGSLNAHAVNLTYRYSWLKDFFNRSLICYSEGAGILLAAWMNGHSIPERIALADWILDICALAERTHRRLYFLGTKQTTLEKAICYLKQKFTSLEIVGYHTGYFEETESTAIVETIRKARPHILIIGRGMPLQEQWLMRHFDKTGAQIALDAGALFDYLAGEKMRCPAWMGRWGFEWFFRLLTEPHKYWKRYLIGNPLFLYRVFSKVIGNSHH